ncbi:MFS transporter [Phenylobacterium sp.]|jgi:MFS family permease|uniref:MFS transporter n=1 Tax=Phenylobacterium sp. TaxID=1871053 RepID=UPI0037845243
MSETQTASRASAPALEAGAPLQAWLLALFLTACYTLSLIDRFILAYVAEPMKLELGLSDFQVGLIQGFAFSITYAVVGLPLGWAVDRFSRTKLIAGAVAFWSVMTMLCGTARGFVSLIAARIGVGGGEAVLTPASYSIMADAFPRRQLPVASTLYSLGPTFATALAAALSGAVLTAAGTDGQITLPLFGAVSGWRAVLITAGAPGLLLALVAFFWRDPSRTKKVAAAEAGSLVGFMRQHAGTHVTFMFVGMLPVLGGYALSAWNPVVLKREFGWSPAEVGAALGTVGLVCGLAGSLIGGAALTWCMRKNRPEYVLMVGATAQAVLAFCGLTAPFAQSGGQFVALVALAAVTTPLMFMLGPTFLQLITPRELRGRATALSLFVKIGIGAGAGPALVGAVNTFVFAEREVALSLGCVIGAAGLIGAVAFVLLVRPIGNYLRHAPHMQPEALGR